MAKLILFSSYIKSQKHSHNLVQYIATREGVEFNTEKLEGVSTDNQKKIIDELIYKFPVLKELEEYEEFLKDNSKVEASEFLTEAFGLTNDKLASKEIYLKYISERPRVEKINTHGLFNSNGEADLKKEIKNIKEHEGIVWTHIISLKREDAAKLGYDNLNRWQTLLKARMPTIAEAMNIEFKNLVWSGAFHNEGKHPHVHLVMYSKNPKEGYLSDRSIEKIKSLLMNEVYKEELLELKQDKYLKREEIKTEFEKELDKTYESIITKNYRLNTKLINNLIELSKMLPSKGKLVYGYQNKEVKEQVNEVLEEILEDKNIKKLYDEYMNSQNKLAAYYSGENLKDRTIIKNNEFRNLQNMVLKAAEKVMESNTESVKLREDNNQIARNQEEGLATIEDNQKTTNKDILNESERLEFVHGSSLDIEKIINRLKVLDAKMIKNDLDFIKNEVSNNRLDIDVKQKIINGAKGLKQEYNLSSNLDIKFKDYSKQNQNYINYFIKSMVFDIADTLYFTASENERQKNKICMRNKKIKRNRFKQNEGLKY